MTDRDISDAKSKILGLVEELDALEYRDKRSLDAFHQRGEMVLRRIYGDRHRYVARFRRYGFGINAIYWKDGSYERAWDDDKNGTRNLLNTLLKEVEEYGLPEPEQIAVGPAERDSENGGMTFRQHRIISRETAIIAGIAFVLGAAITNLDKIRDVFSPDPTPTPTSAPTPVPTQTDTPRDAPEASQAAYEQAIFDYYALVNEGDYGTAWDRLSPDFQINSNDSDYDAYANWWRKQGAVTVLSAKEERMINVNKYVVHVSLLYFGDDNPTSNLFTMTFNSQTGLWLIDEVD